MMTCQTCDTCKEQEVVTLSRREYESLKESQNWLHKLEAAGVDNWDGYYLAIAYNEYEKK